MILFSKFKKFLGMHRNWVKLPIFLIDKFLKLQRIMNYQMSGHQILVKLVDCLIQSRVNVKKSQIRKFDDVHHQIKLKNDKAFDGSYQKLLQSLIIIETLGIRDILSTANKEACLVRIEFNLVDLFTKKSTLAEVWIIQYDHYNQFYWQEDPQSFLMIAKLLEQLLFFLNQQPLFSEFYRHPQFRQNYEIQYNLQILHQKSAHQCGLQNLGHCFMRERTSNNLRLNIQCSCLPKFYLLQCIQSFYKKQSSTLSSSDKHYSPLSKASSSPTSPKRKISLFEVHDEELDFIFLSSDEEICQKGSQNKIREIEIDMHETDEFQLLVCSRDEENYQFVKGIFQELAAYEKQYFNQ